MSDTTIIFVALGAAAVSVAALLAALLFWARGHERRWHRAMLRAWAEAEGATASSRRKAA